MSNLKLATQKIESSVMLDWYITVVVTIVKVVKKFLGLNHDTKKKKKITKLNPEDVLRFL